jgi:hypothetical protein
MQFNLIDAQKEYGKCGDENLGEMLSNLLLEKAKSKEEDLYKILLNECFKVAPKLTNRHFCFLSLVFSINNHYVFCKDKIKKLSDLQTFLNELYESYCSENIPTKSELSYLKHVGCGKFSYSNTIEEVFNNSYPTFFSHQINEKELIKKFGNEKYLKVKSLLLNENLKFKFMSYDEFHKIIEKNNLGFDVRNELLHKFIINLNERGESIEVISKILISQTLKSKNINNLLKFWSGTYLCSFKLNDIGTILAIFKIQNMTNINLNPKDFLNLPKYST